MTYTLRVTKYNPKNRDKNGFYTVDEWIDSSDVGKKINGEILTEDKYFEVENSYIESCIKAMEELNLKKMEVHMLEIYEFDNLFSNDEELLDLFKNIKNKTWLNKDEIRKYLKLVLRNYLWGYLDSGKKGKRKLIIHTGYDYYMYFILNSRIKETRYWAKTHELFPEKMPAYWAFL